MVRIKVARNGDVKHAITKARQAPNFLLTYEARRSIVFVYGKCARKFSSTAPAADGCGAGNSDRVVEPRGDHGA